MGTSWLIVVIIFNQILENCISIVPINEEDANQYHYPCLGSLVEVPRDLELKWSVTGTSR